jgi:hypothetical protein
MHVQALSAKVPHMHKPTPDNTWARRAVARLLRRVLVDLARQYMEAARAVRE